MKIKLSGNAFRAAMNVAAKDDIRFYLGGFYLDQENNKIVSADSHRLITVPFVVEDAGEPTGYAYCSHPSDGGERVGEVKKANLIFDLPAKAPPKNGSVKIDTGDTNGNETIATLYYFDARGNNVGRYQVGVIDAKFPEYESVIPKNTGGKPAAIGFNACYLWDVLKEAKKNSGVQLEFSPGKSAATGPMKVTVDDPEFADVLYVLMPIRF